MLSQTSVGRRALLGFALALAVLATHAVLALINVHRVAENGRRVQQSYEVLDTVRSILSALQDAETGERGYVITGDEQYLEPYYDGRKRFNEELEHLWKLAKTSGDLWDFTELLEEAADTKLDILEKTIEARHEGLEQARQVVAADQGKLAMDSVRDLVTDMLDREQEQLDARIPESAEAEQLATSASLVVGLLGIGVICIAYGLVRREIVQRRESQRFLRSVLDSLTSYIAVLDRQGIILEANDAWRRWSHENRFLAEDVGKNYLDVCRSAQAACEEGPHIAEGIRDVIAGRKASFLMQYPRHTPDAQRWFVVRVTRFPVNGPVRVVVQHDEVTHRVLAEQSIAQRSQQLQRLADISMRLGEAEEVRDIIELIACESRSLIGVHQALASAALEGKGGCVDAVSVSEKYSAWPETAFRWRDAALDQAVCRLSTPLRMTQGELQLHPAWQDLLNDDTRPPLRGWLSAPLMGRDGRNLGLIQLSDRIEGDFTAEDEAILVQLARLSTAALENTRLYQELQESNRRKDEFLAMLGHELRNPLAGIVTSAQVLPMLPQDDPDRQKMQAVIERQVGHMVRMVDDLLDVSRIGRGKLALERKRLDFVQLVEQALDDYQHSHPADHVAAETDTPSEPLWVQGDATRLQQVVTNLIHNACKFSESPCWLRVRVSTDAERKHAVLSVCDRGIGMTPETLARVFEPFNQAANSIQRSRGGMGLGLALVKGLVMLHQGRISARSAGLGQGSEFIVELPLDVSIPPSNGDTKPVVEPIKRRRVLLIDDTRDALFPLERLLTKSGLEVATAYDGPSGLALARQFLPDVVLCDIGLPGMDGYAVAAALRADRDLRDVYLVAVTGYGQEEDRRQARDAGFDYHVTKPVSKANLDLLMTACPRFDGQSLAGKL